MDVYLGTILPCVFDYAPEGWALCDGRSLPVSQNQALYSLIGNAYGGNNVNFNLPDLRGRFPVGMGRSSTPGVAPCVLGAKHDSVGGVTLTSANVPMPAHTHTITNTVSSNGGTAQVSLPINIPVNADTSATLTNVPTNNMLAQGKAGTTTPANIYTSSNQATNVNLKPFDAKGNINIPAPAVTVTSVCGAASGGNVPVDIRPNSLCINYIIAIVGYYPPRP
ncbi:phage tail protein [Clostridium saccharoperbutylacetonicum]